MKNEDSAPKIEKSDALRDQAIREKLGRFIDYTSPAMKELLCHFEGKSHLRKT